MHWLQRKPLIALLVLAAILSFSFMGSRSLWEPDEGRYSNVALQIVDSSEWISLYRHPDSLHFTKPPLTYWMMAASVKTLGANTWALRLPTALAYLLSILMLYQLGKIFCREKPWLPALIFATSVLPFFASNYISADFILAAFETLAVLCFVQYAFLKRSRYWLEAMWVCFGLAFMTKGPPALLPLLAMIVLLWQQKDLAALIRPLGWAAFAIIGLSWYWLVIQRHPGLYDYFIGHELIGRITDDDMGQNSKWYGPILIYLPTLLMGALPWSLALFGLRKKSGGTHTATGNVIETRFLWLWILLPLAIFCISSSRMPLYLLPLFTPIALLLSRKLNMLNFNTRSLTLLLGAWVFVLLGVRYGISNYQHYKDPALFAEKILLITKQAPHEIVFVEDTARYGLKLYLGSDINKVSFKTWPKLISDSRFDMSLRDALEQGRKQGKEGKRIFILKRENVQYFKHALKEKNILPIFIGTVNDEMNRADQARLAYTIPGEFSHFQATNFMMQNAPVARSNWTLATANTSRGPELFAFYGLGAKKTYDDIQKDVHAFNLGSNTWKKVADIPVAQGVLASAAVGLNQHIYLAGGYTVAANGDEKSTPELMRFNPENYTFKTISKIPTPVDDSVLLTWQNRYLIFVSGWHDTGNVKRVQMYDLQENIWLNATQWPGDGVFGHSGGIVGNSMIICDGVTAVRGNDGKNKFAMTNACYRGDLNPNKPADIRWTSIAAHPGSAVYRAAAVGTLQQGKRILFAGGANRAYNYNGVGYDGIPVPASDHVFSFDLQTSQWQIHSPLSAPSMDHRALVEMDGKFYLPGGMRDAQQVTNEGLIFLLK
jgi:N-acetylneuraminic acid mutarotase